MQPRSIILAVLAVPVIVGFFKLFLDVQGDRKAKVDDAELQRALNQFERRERSNSATPPVPRPPRPRASAMTKRGQSADLEETDSAARPPNEAPAPREIEAPLKPAADLSEQMNGANQLYDRADYEGSREAALEILSEHPTNVRMLRIVVSSSCIMGDPDVATKYYEVLPARDQRQMARRCERYGIEFESE